MRVYIPAFPPSPSNVNEHVRVMCEVGVMFNYTRSVHFIRFKEPTKIDESGSENIAYVPTSITIVKK